MESYMNADTFLNMLDWVAFATGLIGAPLGLIEIFKPKLADRIENYLDFIGNQEEEGELERLAIRYAKKTQVPMLLAFLMLIILIYSLISTTWQSDLTALPLNIYWISGMSLFIVGSYFGIFLYLVAIFIKWLDEMTGGHALGGFGVLLIMLGVICDFADKVISPFVQ
jgi:hypothetical protein